MARMTTRAVALVSRLPAIGAAADPCQCPSLAALAAVAPSYLSCADVGTRLFSPTVYRRAFHARPRGWFSPGEVRGLFASLRRFRKSRRRQTASKQLPPKEKELELNVKVRVEEGMPEDPEVLNIAEMLKLNVAMAMKIAFDGLRDSEYKTRNSSINDVGRYEKVELSVLLCHDDFIRKVYKERRDGDHCTSVLSMSQHIPELDLPILMLGDIIISVETAGRQAETRGHTLLDGIRISLVHGLLHLLGFDHEVSDEARKEMEREEELVLRSLGWRGKGLINSSNGCVREKCPEADNFDAMGSVGIAAELLKYEDIPKKGKLRFYRPKFRAIFCDMDGTLLNSRSQVSSRNAEAISEVISRGVKVIIATGNTRPAVIRTLKMVNLAGKNGIVSESSPGVFLQGVLVYGRQGREIFRRNLDKNVCQEALLYSLEHMAPLVAFSEDQCLALFDHPSLGLLHTVYHEEKAEIVPSVECLLSTSEIQKLVFLDTAQDVSTPLWEYWSKAIEGQAGVLRPHGNMLEIVPPGTSKGNGIKMLLDHLDISANEVMSIGDGEDDVEMLQLASFSIALSNGCEKAKSAASVIGVANDEDGVAEAIYQYAF